VSDSRSDADQIRDLLAEGIDHAERGAGRQLEADAALRRDPGRHQSDSPSECSAVVAA